MTHIATIFDPFRPLPTAERSRQLDAYLAFLRERDGEPDMQARTLSERERFFDALDQAPHRSSIEIDANAFADGLAGAAVTDRRLVWLLAAAKANRGERYGVDLVLDKGDPPTLPHDVFVPLEEVYHTRILLDACAIFGLEFTFEPPPARTRRLIALMERSPEWMRLPVILCGEVTGAALFQLLLDELDLFKDDPEAVARLRMLLESILVDELGHVAYCRARIGRTGLRAARALLPTVASGIVTDIPEVAQLGRARHRRASNGIPS
jgi:hypothetical protein